MNRNDDMTDETAAFWSVDDARMRRLPARSRPSMRAVLAALLTITLVGCASHQPNPLDPPAILKELDAVRWSSSDSVTEASIKPRDLAARSS